MYSGVYNVIVNHYAHYVVEGDTDITKVSVEIDVNVITVGISLDIIGALVNIQCAS